MTPLTLTEALARVAMRAAYAPAFNALIEAGATDAEAEAYAYDSALAASTAVFFNSFTPGA